MADRITAVCAFSAAGLSNSDGFRPARIEVIENGIDADRYEPSSNQAQLKQQLGFDPARRYIITIARFHPVKDHRTLLRAFAEVFGRISDVDLLLAGDGPLRPELERLVAELGITNRVRFLGIRHDVPDLLKAADMFVLSSVSEAASITLLEAMASGKPVVVTNVGGNPEIVREGVEGLLTPRGDANAMAMAMRRLLDDRDLAMGMGCRGAERVRAQYQLDRTIARYHQVYEELAQPRT
jgi:glycosyltransferase involved in cell wall biosynthesis